MIAVTLSSLRHNDALSATTLDAHFDPRSDLSGNQFKMFDAEKRSIADHLIERAIEGLRGEKLIESVTLRFPTVTQQEICTAAFLAVTRKGLEERAILPLYHVGVLLRQELMWNELSAA